VLEHYLEVGGNEVVNSSRAYGYATSAGCRANWVKDPKCDTLADAQGEPNTYNYANIDRAPWYDIDNPGLTGRFLGLSGLSIRGLSDSTRTATVTQKNDDGAKVSGYRHGSREIRVRGWLTAEGMDALEHGMTWLRNVLEPNACGIHGGACQMADAEFFVADPPERREEATYSAWAEQRRNLFVNPLPANATGFANANGATNTYDATKAAVRFTPATASSTSGFGSFLSVTPAVGEKWTASFDLESALGGTYRFTGTGAFAGQNKDIVLAAGERRRVSWTVTASSAAASAAYLVKVNSVATDYFWVSKVLVEKLPVEFGYFDGDTPDALDLLGRYEWLGTANNSISVYETRTATYEPEGDDTYFPLVAEGRRFVHQVRAVSGPFEIETRWSRNRRHVGRLVEFTLVAEVPFIFGMPREVTVPPIQPLVIQDVPYNLVPYASAELAGAATVVARNYSTNPSLEVDATGWTHDRSGAITAGMVTSGRVTGELAAVGTASYRAVFTASSSGSAGIFWIDHQVTISGATNTRFSANIWAAEVVMSGSPNRGNLDVQLLWRNGTTVLRTDTLGTIPVDGGSISAKSIAPPATANNVLIRVRANINSFTSGNVVRLYADAAAITVP
jgi:hypothetical protein